MAKARTNRASVDLGRLRHEDVKVYAVTAEGLHDIKMMYHPPELLHASPEGSDSVVFYSPFQVCVLTSRPVLLALTSDDPTFWQVRLGPHADLRGVLVLSKSTSLVEGPPASVGVTYLSEDAGDEVPAGYLRNDKDRAALASYLTGHLGKTDLEIRTLSFVSGLQEVIADGPGVETPSRRIVREPPDIPPDCTNVVG